MIEIKVPMIPGKKPNIVGKIDVKNDDKVEKGQVLCQIETAKGNRQIKASSDGIIIEILVEENQKVKSGDVMILIEDDIDNKQTNNSIETDKSSDNKEDKNSSKKQIDNTDYINTDLLVIGGGPGGYVAAIYGAKRGLKVTLVEEKSLGGTCLNVGCIPTKSIVESAHHLESLKEMELFGIQIDSNQSINLSKVIKRKNNVVDSLVSGIDYLINKNDINLIKGKASFVNDRLVKVNQKTIEARNIIIATGSIANILNVKGNDLTGVINSTDALNLDEIPESLLVIGGGVIGLEFAFIYNSFGSKVHIVEFQDSLIPMLDKDAGSEIEKVCEDKNIKVSTSIKVLSIVETIEGKNVVTFEKNGKMYSTIADKVLMSTGRKANTKGLGLENTTIKVDEKTSDIIVDQYKNTNVSNIYAIGDVSSKLKLAHLASHEAMVAVDHILGEKRELNNLHVPSVVYTDPEIAMVGYSEQELIEKNIEYKSSRFEFVANGKALTMNKNKGFIKIMSSDKDKILGAVICGPDASSLIASLTIAITNDITISQLTHTVFAHPTTSEVIHEACLDLIGRGVHM